MVNKKLLEILACPKTKAPVFQDGDWIISTDPETRLRYPIRDDIPVMLIEEAETMSDDEWRDALGRNGISIPGE
jgi:hypothetical protein